jgi:hypothetical protein
VDAATPKVPVISGRVVKSFKAAARACRGSGEPGPQS